jgi:hypothetical protein
MRSDELIKYVRQQPFQPFRLFLSNGRRFDIHHPELILVTRALITIAIQRGREIVPRDSVVCDPVHITHLEPLNGRTPRGKGRHPGARRR